MRDRAVALGGKGNLGGIGLHIANELCDGFGRKRWLDQEHAWCRAEYDDGRKFRGLESKLLIRLSLIAIGPGGLASSTYPSAGELATASAPRLPPAPARLSMITGWCHASASFSATMRGRASAVPPAGNGTIIRTRWFG